MMGAKVRTSLSYQLMSIYIYREREREIKREE
jgi:hypothetical protein